MWRFVTEFFAILQAICDVDMILIDVVAKLPGILHDARVLRESGIFDTMEQANRPVRGCLCSDSSYMLKTWLLTLNPNPMTRSEQQYTISHTSTPFLWSMPLECARGDGAAVQSFGHPLQKPVMWSQYVLYCTTVLSGSTCIWTGTYIATEKAKRQSDQHVQETESDQHALLRYSHKCSIRTNWNKNSLQ